MRLIFSLFIFNLRVFPGEWVSEHHLLDVEEEQEEGASVLPLDLSGGDRGLQSDISRAQGASGSLLLAGGLSGGKRGLQTDNSQEQAALQAAFQAGDLSGGEHGLQTDITQAQAVVGASGLLLRARNRSGGRRSLNADISQAQVELHAKQGANASSRAHWNLFGQTGPKMTDVSQGDLGDCYYLAGLASIAREHPEVIEQAFVETRKSQKSGLAVYQISLVVDGVHTNVAVDENVPVEREKGKRSKGSFHFAETNDDDHVWPILMEKAFAKVFGSYLAITAGWGYDTFKAITQAPVDVYMAEFDDSMDAPLWPNKDDLWDTIDWALKEHFPMTAGSVENLFGTVSGHEFAVIGAGYAEGHGPTIEVYNPWAANRYKGVLSDKSKRFQGDYTLTFEEFARGFEMLTVARVRPDYRLSWIRVPVNEPIALRFKIKGKQPFSVQLEWPTSRFVNVLGCRLEHKYMKLFVANENGRGGWSSGRKAFFAASNMRVDVSGGRGRYLVYAYGSFTGAPWAEEVVVNVYAAEDVKLEQLDNPLAVGREILGFPCVDIVHPSRVWRYFDDHYEALPYAVGGSPAWQLSGKDKVLWVSDGGTLTRSPSQEQLGRHYSDFDPSQFRCMTSGESQPSQDDRPEPQSEEVAQMGCGFTVGERVSYLHKDHEDNKNWVCGEIDAAFSDGVRVRFLRTGHKTLGCKSRNMKRVTQCEWQEGDRVEYEKSENKWVKELVTEVGCGEVALKSGVVPCGEGTLRYPDGCPFHQGEKVVVWNEKLGKWRFAKVSKVVRKKVTVSYGGKQKQLPCGDEDLLRKISRCDKESHEQLKRFKKLDNFEEILTKGRDSMFPPKISSIGPMGADCGDSAGGAPPEDCSQYNTWGAISAVLH